MPITNDSSNYGSGCFTQILSIILFIIGVFALISSTDELYTDSGRMVGKFVGIGFLIWSIKLFITGARRARSHTHDDLPMMQQMQQRARSQTHSRRVVLQQMQPRSGQNETGMSIPPPRGYRKYRIARDGTELGSFTVAEIQQKLSNNEIALDDYYWDAPANAWLELVCISSLIQEH
jgi:hypothetical protein